MLKKIYQYRFEIFLITQLSILFGSLVFPSELYENTLSQFFLIINVIAGINLISKKRKLLWFLVSLLIIEGILIGSYFIENRDKLLIDKISFFVYFLFYLTVAFEIIKHVWLSKRVNRNVIFGLISGYISLGFIGFFVFLSVDLWYPNSFSGIIVSEINGLAVKEELMYFSYITLMSIGYGDITPSTPMAQKATIFIGLMGQFYMVIITAVIVGKYISQSNQKNNKH